MKNCIKLSKLILYILFPLIVGTISSAISSSGMELYKTMTKPALAPPAVVFPLAWTTLYILMGTATYLISMAYATDSDKKIASISYLIQLGMNFFWPIFFFNMKLYVFSFVWLIIMYIVIITCTIYYFRIDKKAGWLMIPYNIWMAFAAYLNAAIAFAK